MFRVSSLVFAGSFVFSGAVLAANPVITTPSSNYILIDAKAASCKQTLSPTPTDDISSLYTDLGKIKLSWTPTTPDSQLRVVYIKIYAESEGLASKDPKTIAGQDLNCIFNADLDSEVVFPAHQTDVVALRNLILGDLTPKDSSKRSRFIGSAKVVVYGIERTPGRADTPVQAFSEFNFQFDGAF